MKEPKWILVEAVRMIHRRQLAEHGGQDGIRDQGLLESALGRPQNLFAYGGDAVDLLSLAAAYAYALAKNHAFIDGNKRTAYVVCRTFLKLNGFGLEASAGEKYTTFLGLAEGSLSEEELAKWIRDNSKKTHK